MIQENSLRKWGITSFGLHIIAMTLMLSDHLWGTFLSNYAGFGYIGRIAMPIFAFMTVEGFVHTKNRKKYVLRLLIFALISEIPYNLLIGHSWLYPLQQNILWSFLIGIAIMTLYEKIKAKKHFIVRLILYVLTTLAGFILGFILFVDYYGYVVLLISSFYFTRIKPTMKLPHKIILGVIQAAVLYYICCEMIKGMMIPISVFGIEIEIYKQAFALLSLPIIWLYNGRQGPYNKVIKNIYYWFYPVHMFILGLLTTVL